MKKKIQNNISYDIEIIEKSETIVITNFIEEIEKYFRVKLDKDERKYLIAQIFSSSSDNCDVLEGVNYYEVECVTNELITNVEKILKMNLRTDISLYQGILKHMKSALFRIKIGINTKNAILDNIKENYDNLFYIVKDCSKFIERKYDREVSEDEIGYLTLYFQSAIERVRKNCNKNKKNVLIACSTGFATGRLLSCKLSEKFHANILGVTSVHNIKEFINKKIVDIIISTVPIEEDINIPHIVVTPLLNDQDLNKIRSYLKDANFTYDNKFIGDIFKIIDKNCEIKNAYELKKQLNNYFTIKEKEIQSISNFIELDCINLNVDVNEWREAIRISALPLLNKGTINESYIKNMIENIETLGPYIVINEGIAMPHAKYVQNVNGFGITITTLKNSIDIYDKKGIKIFITLATENEKSYVSIMMQIMRLIEDEELIKILSNCNDKNIVYEYIMRISELAC
ncbi:PRD domain-containing protein [Clostridium tarantellae]|uniref:PRD domain-containing protein n=2 Tax=Clostridium tarantellae TaxID=39493 RepID=A0A6I1MNP4_9CLOT|nr:PRD domain-containing protein [Clostridium tarantellae]